MRGNSDKAIFVSRVVIEPKRLNSHEIKEIVDGSLFKVGDKVEVVGYGGLLFVRKEKGMVKLGLGVFAEDDEFVMYDRFPGLVGKNGKVVSVGVRGFSPVYGLSGVEGGKETLYDEQQLVKVGGKK